MSSSHQSVKWAVAAIAVLGAMMLTSAAAQAGSIEAIYTNIAGHQTAQVPGVPGEQFRSPLVPFLTLYGSPVGAHWIFKAFTDNPNSDANDVIVVGSGRMGTVVAKEGDPSPIGGLTYGFMDSDCGINNSARYVFGNRLSGGPASNDEIIFTFDGANLITAVREGDAAPGLVDPTGVEDELFGNSLNSAHILSDNTVAFRADLIQNIHNDYESALYHGSMVLVQEGTPAGPNPREIFDSFVALAGNTFSSSADGGSWIVEADIMPGFGTIEAVVVNGWIELRDGDLLDGLASPVEVVSAVDMAGNGDWFAIGGLANDDRWAVRNGLVIAATGQPITPSEPEEVFAGPMLAANANAAGDFFVIGTTSNPDPSANQVVVLNAQMVIARSGDPVDLDGDGLNNDDAFIESFTANDAFLSDDLNDDTFDDRELYVFATLRNGRGTMLGHAFLVVPLALATCPGDLDSDGSVGILDLLALLSAWGSNPGGPPDFDGDGTVGVLDLLALLANWGPCP